MARPKSEKSFTQMLRIAIQEASDDGKSTKLRALADRLVQEGINGNIVAIKEIADRLDGKSVQVNENHNENMNYEISDRPLTEDEWAAEYTEH